MGWELAVTSVLCVLALLQGVAATRPKGVRAELASLYNPANDFRCLDGSSTVPFIQVNDDYCDCEDGSDEPGTSACPEGKFYCENVGHRELVLPSGRVGDGLCDCCDGSDEWETGSNCENTCSELGREAREAAEAQYRAAIHGFNVRRSMVDEAKRIQEEKVAELAEKETKKAELDSFRNVLERERDAAEAPEKEALDFYKKVEEEENRKREEAEKAAEEASAAEYFFSLDTDADGLVTVNELQARSGLDTNKDGVVSEEEAKFFLSDHEHFDLETFKNTGFVLLKPYLDLEISGAAAAEDTENEENPEDDDTAGTTPEVDWHPMMTPEPPMADPDKPDHPMMTPPPTDDEMEEDDGEYPDEEDEDVDDEKIEDYDINDQDDVDTYTPPDKVDENPKYDEATQALIATAEAARKAFNEADRDLRDVEREIKQIKELLEKDYGEENVFSVLIGQCFELTDNEYKYKMCPFDHSSQRPKHGGSETRLGNWGSWEGGEGANKYSVMKFTGGQGCWNGPARSSTVYLHCGSENAVTAVSEPNKCEYEMHFTTPAICRPPSGHDEL